MNKLPGTKKEIIVTANELSCWQLRRAGWTIEQVAVQLSCSIATVKRWDKKAKEKLTTLPSTQLARDHIQTLVPRAVKAFEDVLDCPATDLNSLRIRLEAASKILNSLDILRDRKNIAIQDDTAVADDRLVDEARRILEKVE